MNEESDARNNRKHGYRSLKWTPKEKTFCIVSVIILIAAAVMALCIGLILPERYFGSPGLLRNAQLYKTFGHNTVAKSVKDFDNSVQHGDIKDYPWLVSISMPRYFDDVEGKDPYVFICNGVILSAKYVLTCHGCLHQWFIRSEADFLTGIIRSGSSFWSVGGQLHRIVDYKYSKNYTYTNTEFMVTYTYYVFFLLKVHKDDPLPSAFLEVRTAPCGYGSKVISLGWLKFGNPPSSVLKFNTFHVEEWKKYKTDTLCHKTCTSLYTTNWFYDNEYTYKDKTCVKDSIIDKLDKNENTDVLSGIPLVEKCGSTFTLAGFQVQLKDFNAESNSRHRYYNKHIKFSGTELLNWLRTNEIDIKASEPLQGVHHLCIEIPGTVYLTDKKMYEKEVID